MRGQAVMLFRTAGLLQRMIAGGKGDKFSVMDTYDYLWTKKERQKAHAEEIQRRLMAGTGKVKRQMTPDEQSAYLQRLAEKMGAE